MKFGCDSCGARYLIPDEKLGPKGVKVRCKKCAHVIILRPPGYAQPGTRRAGRPSTSGVKVFGVPEDHRDEATVTANAPPVPRGTSSSASGGELPSVDLSPQSTAELARELVQFGAQRGGEDFDFSAQTPENREEAVVGAGGISSGSVDRLIGEPLRADIRSVEHPRRGPSPEIGGAPARGDRGGPKGADGTAKSGAVEVSDRGVERSTADLLASPARRDETPTGPRTAELREFPVFDDGAKARSAPFIPDISFEDPFPEANNVESSAESGGARWGAPSFDAGAEVRPVPSIPDMSFEDPFPEANRAESGGTGARLGAPSLLPAELLPAEESVYPGHAGDPGLSGTPASEHADGFLVAAPSRDVLAPEATFLTGAEPPSTVARPPEEAFGPRSPSVSIMDPIGAGIAHVFDQALSPIPNAPSEETVHIEEPASVPNTTNGEGREPAVGLDMSDDLARELGSAFEAMFAADAPAQDGDTVDRVPGFDAFPGFEPGPSPDAGQRTEAGPGSDGGPWPAGEATAARGSITDPNPAGEAMPNPDLALGYAAGPDSVVGPGLVLSGPDAGMGFEAESAAGRNVLDALDAAVGAGPEPEESAQFTFGEEFTFGAGSDAERGVGGITGLVLAGGFGHAEPVGGHHGVSDRASARSAEARARDAASDQTRSEAPAGGVDQATPSWFVAIRDEQVGPLDVKGVEARWTAGELTPDSLCWRPGMADWTPIRRVEDLRHLGPPVPPVVVTPVVSESEDVVGPEHLRISPANPAPAYPESASGTEPEDLGWRPSAASALASLAAEELAIEPATVHTSLADVSPAEPPAEELAKLLAADDGRPSGTQFGAAEKTGMHLRPLPRPADAVRSYPLRDPVDEKPRSSGLWILVGAIVGGMVLLGLIIVGALIYLRDAGSRNTNAPAANAPVPMAVAPSPVAGAVASAGAVRAPAVAPAPPAVPVAGREPPHRKMEAGPNGGLHPASADQPGSLPERAEATASRGGGPVRAPAAGARGKGRARTSATGRRKAEASGGSTGERRFSKRARRRSARRQRAASRRPSRASSRPPPVSEPPSSEEDDLLEPGRSRRAESAPSVKRQLDESDLFGVMRRHRSEILRCRERQAAADPTLDGTMTVEMVIQRSGRPTRVRVTPPRFRGATVGTCVMSAVKNWRFPRFSGRAMPVDFPVRVGPRR